MLRRHYAELAKMARRDDKLTYSHSVEEAEVRHVRKRKHKAHTRAEDVREGVVDQESGKAQGKA